MSETKKKSKKKSKVKIKSDDSDQDDDDYKSENESDKKDIKKLPIIKKHTNKGKKEKKEVKIAKTKPSTKKKKLHSPFGTRLKIKHNKNITKNNKDVIEDTKNDSKDKVVKIPKKVWMKKQKQILDSSIDTYTNDITQPPDNIGFMIKPPDKWPLTKEYTIKEKNELKVDVKYETEKLIYSTIPINLYFTKNQRKVINSWLEAHRQMYNQTLYYIKSAVYNKKNYSLKYRELRTGKLNSTKKRIIKDNTIKVNGKKIKPGSHMIDSAIKLACANYQSALTNLENGRIKHFRIRYWRRNKDQLCFEVETKAFSPKYDTIFKHALGYTLKYESDYKIKLSEIKSDSGLVYYRNQNKYVLFVSCSKETEETKDTGYVGLDPGIREFMTCYSKEKIFTVNYDRYKIQRQLNLIDKVNNNKTIPSNKKRSHERRRRAIIQNYRDNLHWKAIKVILKGNKYVFIGNMSAKRIISKSNRVLNKMTKRIVSCLGFYIFRQRLEYKCKVYQKCCRIVNEMYTSKTCSKCTQMYEIKGNKVYNCKNKKCTVNIDRDVNSAINILMRGIYEMK